VKILLHGVTWFSGETDNNTRMEYWSYEVFQLRMELCGFPIENIVESELRGMKKCFFW